MYNKVILIGRLVADPELIRPVRTSPLRVRPWLSIVVTRIKMASGRRTLSLSWSGGN